MHEHVNCFRSHGKQDLAHVAANAKYFLSERNANENESVGIKDLIVWAKLYDKSS